MNLANLTQSAMNIRKKYSQLSINKTGKEWTRAEIAQGFVGDVGDLMKLVMAKEGIREIDNVDEKLKHELSDCLWSILVLANEYDIDLEESFVNTRSDLGARFEA